MAGLFEAISKKRRPIDPPDDEGRVKVLPDPPNPELDDWGGPDKTTVEIRLNEYRANHRTGINTFSALRKVCRKYLTSDIEQIMNLDWRVSSMVNFLRVSTPVLALGSYSRKNISLEEYQSILRAWVVARSAILGTEHNGLPRGIPFTPTTKEGPKKMDQQVNPDRNEMIALLQGAKGMQFVGIQMNFSRLSDEDEGDDARPKNKGPALIFKALDLGLKQGDIVVVQYRERFGIGRVSKVFSEAPTSDQYDYRIPLKHVVQKIDTVRSAQLEALDHSMLKKITASEAQDRLERMTRQLGISLADVSLELPAPGAIEPGDDGFN